MATLLIKKMWVTIRNFQLQKKFYKSFQNQCLKFHRNHEVSSGKQKKPRSTSRNKSMMSKLNRSEFSSCSQEEVSQKEFINKQLYSESKELERIFMKIKRSKNHYESWKQKDELLKTQMEVKRQKKHNRYRIFLLNVIVQSKTLIEKMLQNQCQLAQML